MAAIVSSIDSYMILDSRGYPTLKTEVRLDDGTVSTSAVPGGTSTGTYEAVELRDGDEHAYRGLGVTKAIEHVKTIIGPAVIGKNPVELQEIDKIMLELDGTSNKSKLGANATLSVSQAVAKAAAKSQNMELYEFINSFQSNNENITLPNMLVNMLEGGTHADNGLDFQEYLLIPASQKPFEEKLTIAMDVYQSLKHLLREQSMSTLTADEGGFAPSLSSNKNAIILLKNAVEQAGYGFARDAFAGLDLAANHFTDQELYKLIDRNTAYSVDELINYYKEMANEYSILYLEDPFSEDDLQAWTKLRETMPERTVITGDDLTVTNPYRLQMALEAHAIGGIIIKPNQIGTVSESMAVAEMAHAKGIQVVVSHRSGETPDDFIADFAVGVGADYVKFGAPAHERMVKYNRLIEINRLLTQS